QREDEYRGPGREILYFRPQRGVEAQHERAETARHRDVLLAVDGVADGTSTMAGARAEVPELLARVGVVRVHGALEVSVDHEAAARREQPPDRRILEVDAPLALAGDGITRVEVTVEIGRASCRERGEDRGGS